MTKLYSKAGLLLANDYNKIVVGGRGTYIEILPGQIVLDHFYIPHCKEYRLNDKRVYYVEYRSICPTYAKLYFQLKTVKYADYIIGRYYISPNDLAKQFGK